MLYFNKPCNENIPLVLACPLIASNEGIGQFEALYFLYSIYVESMDWRGRQIHDFLSDIQNL